MSTLTLHYSVDDQQNVHIDKPGPQELPLTLTVAPSDKDATIDAIDVFLAGADAAHISQDGAAKNFNRQIPVTQLPIELKVQVTKKGAGSDTCVISLTSPPHPGQRPLPLTSACSRCHPRRARSPALRRPADRIRGPRISIGSNKTPPRIFTSTAKPAQDFKPRNPTMSNLAIVIVYDIDVSRITLHCANATRVEDILLIPSDQWQDCLAVQLSVVPSAGSAVPEEIAVTYVGGKIVSPEGATSLTELLDFTKLSEGMSFTIEVHNPDSTAHLQVALVPLTARELVYMLQPSRGLGTITDLLPLPPPKPVGHGPQPLLPPSDFSSGVRPVPRPGPWTDLRTLGLVPSVGRVLLRMRSGSLLRDRRQSLQVQQLERLSAQVTHQAQQLQALRAGLLPSHDNDGR